MRFEKSYRFKITPLIGLSDSRLLPRRRHLLGHASHLLWGARDAVGLDQDVVDLV